MQSCTLCKFFDLNSIIGQAHKEPADQANHLISRPRALVSCVDNTKSIILRQEAALVSLVDITESTFLCHPPDGFEFYNDCKPANTGFNILASPNEPGPSKHERANFSVLTSESWEAPASPVKSLTRSSTIFSSPSLSIADTITANGSPRSRRMANECRRQLLQKEGSGGIRRSSVLLTDRQRCKLSLSKGSRVEDEGLLM